MPDACRKPLEPKPSSVVWCSCWAWSFSKNRALTSKDTWSLFYIVCGFGTYLMEMGRFSRFNEMLIFEKWLMSKLVGKEGKQMPQTYELSCGFLFAILNVADDTSHWSNQKILRPLNRYGVKSLANICDMISLMKSCDSAKWL